MALVPVQDYEAGWNSEDNVKQIKIWISSWPDPWSPTIDSDGEFAAILMMLSKPGVQVEPGKKYFVIPRRSAGT